VLLLFLSGKPRQLDNRETLCFQGNNFYYQLSIAHFSFFISFIFFFNLSKNESRKDDFGSCKSFEVQMETSLQKLGFKIEPIKRSKRSENWLFRVRGKAPVFYLKGSRYGRLRAFKKGKVNETTIGGLYGFETRTDGQIVGRPLASFFSKRNKDATLPKRVQLNVHLHDDRTHEAIAA
jgi:hypothetical protein